MPGDPGRTQRDVAHSASRILDLAFIRPARPGESRATVKRTSEWYGHKSKSDTATGHRFGPPRDGAIFATNATRGDEQDASQAGKASPSRAARGARRSCCDSGDVRGAGGNRVQGAQHR